jgi:CHAT domain-containing protein/tetratricopeptide (TPR) repeat protein
VRAPLKPVSCFRWNLCIGLLTVAVSSAANFTTCQRELEAAPFERQAAECFVKADPSPKLKDEAINHLTNMERRHPASGWLTFFRAQLGSRQSPVDSAALYRSAITKFSHAADAVGEVEARLAVGQLLASSGQRREAWLEAPKVLEAARKSQDKILVAKAIIYQATLSQRTGERLGQSARLLKEAEQLVFPGGPYPLQRQVLGGLGKLNYDMGRYEDSQSYYAALLKLARDHNEPPLAAQAAYTHLLARRKQMEDLPEPERLPEFTAASRELVVLADSTGRPRLQAMAHRSLADLLWPVAENRKESEAYYRSALAFAEKAQDASELASALWGLGRILSSTQPKEANRLINQALRIAVDSGDATAEAYAWRQKMRLDFVTLPRERAASESMRALGAIERLRTLQDPGMARAAVLAAWTPDYHWLIGALLNTSTPAEGEVALAFEVAERMRARLLLDSLQRTPAAPANGSTRQQLLLQISAVQRQLLDPRVQGVARASAAARLERIEREEESARVEFDTEVEAPKARSSPIVSLKSVERTLGENEAMLSFSVGVGQNFYGLFAGGAWLFISTNAGTRVISLPDRTTLHPAMFIFRGLSEKGDNASVPTASAKLYAMVMGRALAALPKRINRLIVIPDGPLHHLPFAALRPEPQMLPLGSTHEILIVPSASVWMRLRQAPRVETSDALVLADPTLPMTLRAEAMAREREWRPEVLQLGSLPYARREGRAIVRTMGRGSRLLTGRAATESAVKADGLKGFLLVHFATHAMVDDLHPERSAILLAGNEHGEDGLLQAREIAELTLPGRMVVLSACRSATGAVLAGEGVLGLSRSFFEAGARTILGTLWPIRDDHAAAFFEKFYAAFGRGLSVGAALREARQQSMSDGVPASVWSSVVAMGDDTVAVHPVAGSGGTRLPILILAGAVVTLAVAAAAIRKVRRKTR